MKNKNPFHLTRRCFLLIHLFILIPLHVTAQNPQKGTYGYLYCHMSDYGEWTAFAVSRDGYHYRDICGGQPIFNPIEHARIEGGTRDAYICRSHNGKGYLMVTTDMCVAQSHQWNNYGIDLLKSDDLIHWTSVTFDFRKGQSLFCDPTSPDPYQDYSTINRVWAPQIFWNPDYKWENGKYGGYLIYYSMLNRAEEKYDRMYYSYADETFTRLTKPRLLFDWGYATIDADINYLPSDRLYHMLIKKEGGKPGIYTTTAQALHGPWKEPLEHDFVSFEGKKLCEGSSAFQLIGEDTWRVAYIQYSDHPKHYRICQADAHLQNFHSPVDIEGVTAPQHGSFMRLTQEEYDRLIAYDTLWRKASATITVRNDGDSQRQEVVEIDADKVFQKLGVAQEQPIIIRNALGQEVNYQISYDRKLLLDVSVCPHSSAQFTVSYGRPSPMKSWVYGNFYPIRKDDLAWENDRGAYRAYGPALERSGEKAYGIDVWVKNTPELVINQRYLTDYEGNQKEDSLRKAGKHQEAASVDLATSFHLDHGNGHDCYQVGPTLGCGTPALMKDGELIYPYCFKDYRILDKGPLRFTVQLDYGTEHRIISLDKGSHFNKTTVWYDNLKGEYDLAAGVVIHSADTTSIILNEAYILYADPTENRDKHQCQIYVGVLFPYGISTTEKHRGKNMPTGTAGHAIGIRKHYHGEKFTYYFGSAWSKYDVRTLTEWQLRTDEFMQNLRQPLKTEIN